jgi:putative membrane-bound dehydrogenase-like protein
MAFRNALFVAILPLLVRVAFAAEMPVSANGFVIEKVAAEPNVLFPMFAAFDDRGRLFVAESSGLDLYAELTKLTRKCRVRILEDRDGDGRYGHSHIFAENLVFPMGLAWHDGRLYVADGPELVALEDTDNDGRADKRTVIMSGFGHSDNGGLHGLIFGPDGLLYMTLGQPDGYDFKRADGTRMFGQTGGLVRCRADGSNPEVICRGFENLVEIAFLPSGEIIGTNNWYYTPAGGVRDALVHLMEGGLYPRHADRGTPQLITGDPLPPLTVFPAVALSGLMRYSGASFPQEYRGNLFSAQHNTRKIGRHILEHSGSTFRSRDSDFVSSADPDFHPADVLEDADGSVLIVDTGGWYVQHCPTGKIRASLAAGGIYRVRAKGAAPLNDPWGLAIDWPKASVPELAAMLGDRRPAVRRRAERALQALGQPAVESVAALLTDRVGSDVCEHAVWALAGIQNDAALVSLRGALTSANPQVAALACRALAFRGDRQASTNLERLLTSNDPALRSAAADALAHCGGRVSIGPIQEALAGPVDRMLEHALIHALYQLANADDLRRALEHPHPRVQQAALLLLDQPPHRQATAEQVFARITSADPELRRTAQGILKNHPDWAGQALGVFHRWLEGPQLSADDQQRIVESILAFGARREVIEWLGSTLAERNEKIDASRRVVLLQAMGRMARGGSLATWVEPLRGALRDSALRGQAVRTIGLLRMSELDDELARLVGDERESAELRVEALRAIVSRHPKLGAATFDLLLNPLAQKSAPAARLTAAEILAQAELSDEQLGRFLAAVGGDPLISPDVLLPLLTRSAKAATATALFDYLRQAVGRGWKPGEEKLVLLLEPLKESHKAAISDLLASWRERSGQQRERLAKLEPLLVGGDAQRGREVFFGQRVSCTACHRIGATGGQVGPDLTKVGAIRSGRDLLESIVVPSSTIAQGFDSYVIATKAGEQLSGILVERNADGVVLRDSSGADHRLQNSDMRKMRREATSIMPEGLDQALTAEEFRDLLAFLQGLR